MPNGLRSWPRIEVILGPASPTVESGCVVIVSNRFGRRLRVALRSWAHQLVPSGTLEVIVINPASPDITHTVVAEAACENPGLRVAELPVDAALVLNKGALINLGISAARGEWIWLTDADCVYPPASAAHVLASVDSKSALYYCERHHLVHPFAWTGTTDFL